MERTGWRTSRRGWAAGAAAVLAGCVVAWGADAAGEAGGGEGDKPATGKMRITLTERSPLSAIGELQERYGWGGLRNPAATYEYKPADEALDVVVPEGYDGTEAYGLMVWVNAGRGGEPPAEWVKALAERRLIWAGAVNTGNDRQPVAQRIMLAIDAAAEMQRRYRIDASRVYVAGLSGGGRMASQAAMAFPDVFAGAMPIVGVDYFRRVIVPDTEYQYNTFGRPSPQRLRKLLTESRMVLVTGERDFNRPQVEAVYKAMVADRFKHVSYLEQPGMGHGLPDAEWFVRGLALLDEPLTRVTREHFADGERLEQLGRFGGAVEAYERAAEGTADRPVAMEGGRKARELRKLLADALAVVEAKIEAGRIEGLVGEIQKVKDAWTPLADEAAARLVERVHKR